MNTASNIATAEGTAFRHAALAKEVLMTASLVSLAAAIGLHPAEAIALPSVVDVFASKVGMTPDAMIAEAMHNAPLRDYIAEICRKPEVMEAAL